MVLKGGLPTHFFFRDPTLLYAVSSLGTKRPHTLQSKGPPVALLPVLFSCMQSHSEVQRTTKVLLGFVLHPFLILGSHVFFEKSH